MHVATEPQTQKLDLRRWLAFFVIFGVALRIFRYAMGLPIFGDEGFLGVNILDRSFRGLLRPMEYIQVAPLGFLWIERAIYLTLGMSEYALRLIPTLAGIAGLILFAVWARKILDPLAATLATGVLAVSDLAIRHAVELKPYGIDLFVGILLLYPATVFFADRKTRRLWFLIAVTPIALFVSLPSIFVAAGIAATLFFHLPRLPAPQLRLVVIFSAVVCVTFGALAWGFIGPQFAGSGPSQQLCWTFPPYQPLQFLLWFARTHSSSCFGYPLDFSTPGSAPSFLLLVIGAAVLFRTGRGSFGLLLISPFVMTLIAALLRRYPYADSPRVAQHLVGPICLLIGAGTAAVIRRLSVSGRALRLIGLAAFFYLSAIGLISAVSPLIAPTGDLKADIAVRKFVRESLRDLPPQTTVIVLENPDQSDILLRWYIHDGPRNLLWGIPASRLSSMTSGPLLIASSRMDLNGLDEQIAHEMGEPPKPPARFLIHNSIGLPMAYEILFYPGPNLRRPGRALAAPDLRDLLPQVVDRIQ